MLTSASREQQRSLLRGLAETLTVSLSDKPTEVLLCQYMMFGYTTPSDKKLKIKMTTIT